MHTMRVAAALALSVFASSISAQRVVFLVGEGVYGSERTLPAFAAELEEKLGFEVLPRPDFGGFQGAWYRVGDLQLHLSVVEEMPDLKGGFPHLAVYVPTEHFEDTVAALKAMDVPFVMDTMEREDFGVPVKAAFCKDPDGNVVELTDVGPLP